MSTKDYSDLQEKQIAKLVGGNTQSNSGGTRFGGGDVKTNYFLIEAKTPTSPRASFSIRHAWIKKASEQAFEQGKQYSAVAFRFKPDGDDYFVISHKLFKQFVLMLEKLEEV